MLLCKGSSEVYQVQFFPFSKFQLVNTCNHSAPQASLLMVLPVLKSKGNNNNKRSQIPTKLQVVVLFVCNYLNCQLV